MHELTTGEKELISLLVRQLHRENKFYRKYAAWKLGTLKEKVLTDENFLDTILQKLQKNKEYYDKDAIKPDSIKLRTNVHVRRQILETLQFIGEEIFSYDFTIKALLSQLQAKDYLILERTIKLLKLLPEEKFNALSEADKALLLERDKELDAIRKSALKSTDNLEEIIKKMNSKNLDDEFYAISCFRNRGSEYIAKLHKELNLVQRFNRGGLLILTIIDIIYEIENIQDVITTILDSNLSSQEHVNNYRSKYIFNEHFTFLLCKLTSQNKQLYEIIKKRLLIITEEHRKSSYFSFLLIQFFTESFVKAYLEEIIPLQKTDNLLLSLQLLAEKGQATEQIQKILTEELKKPKIYDSTLKHIYNILSIIKKDLDFEFIIRTYLRVKDADFKNSLLLTLENNLSEASSVILHFIRRYGTKDREDIFEIMRYMGPRIAKSPILVQEVLTALNDQNINIRSNAIVIIGWISDFLPSKKPIAQKLVQYYLNSKRSNSLFKFVFLRLGRPAIAELAIAYNRMQIPVMQKAIYMLGGLGQNSAFTNEIIQVMFRALKHPYKEIYKAATSMLTKMANKALTHEETIPTLSNFITLELKNKDKTKLHALLDTFLSLGKQIYPELQKLLMKHNKSLTKLVVPKMRFRNAISYIILSGYQNTKNKEIKQQLLNMLINDENLDVNNRIEKIKQMVSDEATLEEANKLITNFKIYKKDDAAFKAAITKRLKKIHDSDPFVRINTINGIRDVFNEKEANSSYPGYKYILTNLLNTLSEHPDKKLREALARMLKSEANFSEEHIPLLLKIKREEKQPKIRNQINDILAKMPSEEIIREFQKDLEETEDFHLRFNAQANLEFIWFYDSNMQNYYLGN